MSFPSQPAAVSMVLTNSNAAHGTGSAFQYRNSPYQNVGANQISAVGVTAFKRLVPPVIANADTIDREEGYIGYDHDAERLCYTDSTLAWRCAAVLEDIPGLGSTDFVAAMLLVSNAIHTHTTGYNVPATGYRTLVDWTTAPPFVGSANWNNATGIYTAATAGTVHVTAQCSWLETQKNQGVRVFRLIHTDGGTLATTILAETVTNPSSNKNVNTTQHLSGGATLAAGDTLHVEVAQTSGVTKNVEGGGAIGTSGTTLQIMKIT